jgi:DNA-binding response OmpR family regulator
VASTRQAGQDECLAFQPHLLVLDVALPGGDGFSLVNWLREREILARLPLVVYSGRELAQAGSEQLTLEPTHLLTRARVQPLQLETLVLTMLCGLRHAEDSVSEVSGVHSS